jgi:hypothetical protein
MQAKQVGFWGFLGFWGTGDSEEAFFLEGDGVLK